MVVLVHVPAVRVSSHRGDTARARVGSHRRRLAVRKLALAGGAVRTPRRTAASALRPARAEVGSHAAESRRGPPPRDLSGRARQSLPPAANQSFMTRSHSFMLYTS